MADDELAHFQLTINSEDHWSHLIARDGLTVIDVADDWCGSCKPISKLFWKLKNALNDNLLVFAIAVSNNIDSLRQYQKQSQPCFLFYAGGILVDVVRGANGPELMKHVKMRLQQEYLVIKGQYDRDEIIDPYFKQLEEIIHQKEINEEMEEIKKEVILLILKPDLLKMTKMITEVKDKILEANIKIIHEEIRQITTENYEKLFNPIHPVNMNDVCLKKFIYDSSYLLLLSKEIDIEGTQSIKSVIENLTEIIGPVCLEQAQLEYPKSYRAVLGKKYEEDLFYYSDDKEVSEREISIFYPDYTVSLIKIHKSHPYFLERTLAIMRPTCCRLFKDVILDQIMKEGFSIVYERYFSMTTEDVENFYKSTPCFNDTYYEDLVSEMTDGASYVMCLERHDAINHWRHLIGSKHMSFIHKYQPNCFRALYSCSDVYVNLIHGSANYKDAKSEISYMFPVEQAVVVVKPDSFSVHEEIQEIIEEAGFIIARAKEVRLTREMVENIYEKEHLRKPYYSILVDSMLRSPAYFIVASKVDANNEIQKIVGDKNPEVAAEQNPESIRALYGINILNNSVCSSKMKEEADKMIEMMFGEIEFDQNGLVKNEGEFTTNDSRTTDMMKQKSIGDDKELEYEAEQFINDIFAESKKQIDENEIPEHVKEDRNMTS